MALTWKTCFGLLAAFVTASQLSHLSSRQPLGVHVVWGQDMALTGTKK
jgi:hypothetical protein